MKNALKNEVVKVEKVDAPIYLKSKSLLRVVVGKKVSVKFHSPLTNFVVLLTHCSKLPFLVQKSQKIKKNFSFFFDQKLDFYHENSIILTLFRMKSANF